LEDEEPPLLPSSNTEADEEKSSSVVGATFSLMKTLVGTGMLALPSGLAVVSDQPAMLWSANAMLLGLGVLSAYTFWSLGRLANATGGRTLSDMWARVFLGSSARVVSVANLVYCVGLCLAYSLVLGDSLSALGQSAVGATSASSSSWLLSRQSVILSVTAFLLWPLCNLKSLAALAPFSIAGVLSSLFVTIFVAWRCPALVPSSPYRTGGSLVKLLSPALQPRFGTYNRMLSAAPVVLIALGCVAWMGHFSGPEFYHALGNRKESNSAADPPDQAQQNQLKKYSIMTVTGYSIVAVLNALVLSFGFLTFGGNAQGNVLNNYAVSDVGATLSRFLVSVSVASGYPFLFSAARSSARSLFGNGKSSGTVVPSQSRVSKTLMLLITGAALVVQDAGFVVSLIGAIAGTAIIYIFPPLLFLKRFAKERGVRWRLERGFCRFLVGFGAVSAVLGTVAAVVTTYFPLLLQ
jgi:amino acid permease